MDEERLPTRTYALALAAIVGVALALRAAGLGSIPPGLYHDEAYNGLDALQVLGGQHTLWFAANNGREPLFIYLIALSVRLLGRTVIALRAPALLLGLLTVPATAFLGSGLFNRRVGLLAAAVTAVTFWPVHLSRVGFRAVGLPLCLALAIGLLWRGLRSGRRLHFALAGVCYGASLYTYLAARFTPIPLVGLGLLLLWPAARLPRPRWAGLGIFLAAALVTAAPLGAYMLLRPDVLAGRTAQVSILNPAISHGDPWGTLARHIGRALAAFFLRGDRIPRHNLPWRPIFDPALALAFILGLIVAARRRGAGWFTLLWVGAMLLPTILAEDTPHFLRGVGIQPFVFLLPALGLAAAWRWLEARKRGVLGAALVGLALFAGLAGTANDYFRAYARAETVYYHFESGSTELAAAVNDFLADDAAGGSRVAYISQHLWQGWPSLRFLVSAGPNVQIIDPANPPAPGDATEVLLATWPFEPYQPALSLLPGEAQVEASCDLYERGDLDPEARELALIFRATPYTASPPQAVLEQGIRLIEARVEPAGGQELHVRLVWEALQPVAGDYTAFVQVLHGGTVAGQHDGPPVGGRLPTTLWQPGQRIVDVHQVHLPAPYDPQSDRVIVGLYELESMQRLHVIESAVAADNDAIPVGAP